MAGKKLKIVIWCGQAANQKALACKIASAFDVAGMVIDTHSGKKKKRKLFQIPILLWDRLRFRSIYNAWSNLMNYYENRFPGWPDVRRIDVPDINSNETEIFTRQLQPDLIIVSGSALIKEPLISIPATIGVINLHTGLSPYVKGGPNCTNWCIANNSFHLVGNTIMWLNAGIDSGNIITSETVDITQADNLNNAHQMVMDHAHDLYLRAIRFMSESNAPYPSVPQQNIAKGELFLTRMWTTDKKKILLTNWRKRRSFISPFTPTTVSLNN